jgi:hypothetical protein
MQSPYVGLTYFTAADATRFFGREAEAEIIATNLLSSPLTVLYGDSGVGKSSLLRAAMPQQLRRLEGVPDGDRSEVTVVFCSDWRDDPIRALADAVRDADPQVDAPADDLLATVHAAVRTCSELFVVLDQFEEYFLYHDASDDRWLADELRRVLADRALPVSFMISLRADALARLDRLREIPRLFDRRLELRPLTREGAREAIVRPLEAFNQMTDGAPVSIEPELVDVVLSQVTTGRIALGAIGEPSADGDIEAHYLQLVMQRLWDEEQAAGSSVLRLATLDALGGADRIVGTHLDRSLAALPEGEREIAAEIFRYLVTPSGTKIALSLDDLVAFSAQDREPVHRVVEHLAGERVLRVTASREGVTRYEIFHDVLAAGVLEWSTRLRLDREDRQRRIEERQRFLARRSRRRLQVVVVALALSTIILALLQLA